MAKEKWFYGKWEDTGEGYSVREKWHTLKEKKEAEEKKTEEKKKREAVIGFDLNKEVVWG